VGSALAAISAWVGAAFDYNLTSMSSCS
jgi:hypothetical protein